MGSAGYGTDDWVSGQSYATDPVLRPAYYNHSAPAGKRFDSNLPSSTIERLYHSTATLLPDGSVFISGSNPNSDVVTQETNPDCAQSLLAVVKGADASQICTRPSTAPRSSTRRTLTRPDPSPAGSPSRSRTVELPLTSACRRPA